MSVTIKFREGLNSKSYTEVIEKGESWSFHDGILSVLNGYKTVASFPNNGNIESVQVTGGKSIGLDTKDDRQSLFINFILDETGSMFSVLDATISGFNEYIAGLKSQPENKAKDIKFTLTQFNSNQTRIIHNSVKLRNVHKLTRQNYTPNFATPLYDAIGETIQAMEGKVNGANVLCVIQTDGEENASREWDRQKIFDLISKKQKEGWTFAFLGANQDAWKAGGAMGIPMLNTLSYTHSPRGMSAAMAGLASATIDYTSHDGAQTSTLFEGKTDIRDKTSKE